MTKIEWTERTWNPIGGCRKISLGCMNCYAIRHAHRMAGHPNSVIAQRYSGLTQIEGGRPNWTGRTFLNEDVLAEPLLRKQPTTYFISLSDLFYPERNGEHIDRVLSVMEQAHWHTFQVLTKYSQHMESRLCRRYSRRWIPPNIWFGVSVEDQSRLDRIKHLRQTPAALRFISLEPLLEDLGRLDLTGIDWVIVGGESGPHARECREEWVRSIVEQCRAARVPCFVKQMGADFQGSFRVTGKGNDQAEWPEDLRVREYPKQAHDAR